MRCTSTIGKRTVITALFAALTSASCFIQIPLPGGIPIIIQDMMAMLSGLLLGPLYGAAAVLIFLILGCLGLPVFSGKAGLHVILSGPTGGFLIGYLLAAFIGGLILHIFYACKPKARTEDGVPPKAKPAALEWLFISIAAVAATTVMFAAGIIGFHRIFPDKTMAQVAAAVLIPFLPGNIVKLAVMIPLTKKVRPAIASCTA
ncbi:MAG: biotin transporter BioY [Treponemataceae bacterium]|nr:biotin transporter BioY [Treponemataceae bacterium]